MPTTVAPALAPEVDDRDVIDSVLADALKDVDPNNEYAERLRNRAINLAAQRSGGKRYGAAPTGELIDAARRDLAQPSTLDTQQLSDLQQAKAEGREAGLGEQFALPFRQSRLSMYRALAGPGVGKIAGMLGGEAVQAGADALMDDLGVGGSPEDQQAARLAQAQLAAESSTIGGAGGMAAQAAMLAPMAATGGIATAARVGPRLAAILAGTAEGATTAPMFAGGATEAADEGASIPGAIATGAAQALPFAVAPRVLPGARELARPVGDNLREQAAHAASRIAGGAAQGARDMALAQTGAEAGTAVVGMADPAVAAMQEHQGGIEGSAERIAHTAGAGAVLGAVGGAARVPGEVQAGEDAAYERRAANAVAASEPARQAEQALQQQEAARQDQAARQAAFEELVAQGMPAYEASVRAQEMDAANLQQYQQQRGGALAANRQEIALNRMQRQAAKDRANEANAAEAQAHWRETAEGQAQARREAETAAAEANRIRAERGMPELPPEQVAARSEQAAQAVPPRPRLVPKAPEPVPLPQLHPLPRRPEPVAVPFEGEPGPRLPGGAEEPRQVAPVEQRSVAEQPPAAEAAKSTEIAAPGELSDLANRVSSALSGTAEVTEHGDGLHIQAGDSHLAVLMPRDPNTAVDTLMDRRHDRGIVASLAGREGGTLIKQPGSPRGIALTADDAGLALWRSLPDRQRREFISSAIRRGDLSTFTVLNPTTGERAPLPAAAHLWILNPEVKTSHLAHESAHVALTMAMHDAEVVNAARVLQQAKRIQTVSPGAPHYVDPRALEDPKALRQNPAFEEAFAYGYQQFFEQRQQAVRAKAAPTLLARLFLKLRQTFQRMFRIRQKVEQVNPVDQLYQGTAETLQRGLNRENVRPREDQLYTAEVEQQRQAAEQEAARAEKLSRQDERRMAVERKAELAQPSTDTAKRIAEIRSEIERRTGEANKAVDEKNPEAKSIVAEHRRRIAELKAEEGKLKASLAAEKTSKEGEDAQALAEPPPEEGGRFAFGGKNKAIQSMSERGRELEAKVNEEEPPARGTVSADRQAGERMLRQAREASGQNLDVAYSNLVRDMTADAVKGAGEGTLSLNNGQTFAIHSIMSYWDNRLAKAKSPAERAKAEKALTDAIILKNLHGSEYGRGLASFVDQLQSPAERVSFLRDMLSNPSKTIAARISKLHREGRADEARQLAVDAARSNYEKTKARYKEEFGADVDELLRNPDLFDGDEGLRFAFEVASNVAALTDPPSYWQLAKALYQNNLLTPSGQLVANNVGNLLYGGTKLLGTALTNPGEAATMVNAMRKSVGKAMEASLSSFAKGYSVTEATSIGSLRRAGGRDAMAWKDPVVNPTTKAAKIVSALSLGGYASRRLGILGDEFMSVMWLNAAIAAEARRRGMDVDAALAHPTPEMKEAAGRVAAEMTFRAEQDPKGFLAGVNKLRQHDSAAGLAATLAMPFFNTLVNLTKAGWNMSPIGATINSGADLARYFAERKNQGDFGKQVAAKIVGRMLVAAAVYGIASGTDTSGTGAAFSENPAEYGRESRSGEQRTMKAGGYDINLNQIQPLALPLLQGVDLNELASGKLDFPTFLSRQFRGAIGEQYFQGVAQLAGDLAGGSGWRPELVNTASGFVPGRGVARDLDRFSNSGNRLESGTLPSASAPEGSFWRDVLRQGSPQLADMLYDPRETRRDLYGRERERGIIASKSQPEDLSAWDNWFERASREVDRQVKAAQAAGNTPLVKALHGIREPTLGKPEADGVKLTEEQYAEAKRLAGEAFVKRLRGGSMDPATLPADPQRLKALTQIYHQIWKAAVGRARAAAN